MKLLDGIQYVLAFQPLFFQHEVLKSNIKTNNDKIMFHTNKRLKVKSDYTKQYEEKIGLDIGCGEGLSTHELYVQYPHYKIIGIDKDEWNIKKAKETYKNVKFLVNNAENIVFPKNSIDVIQIKNCFFTFESPEKVLLEALSIVSMHGEIQIIQSIEELKKYDSYNIELLRWRNLLVQFESKFLYTHIGINNGYYINLLKSKKIFHR
jgi:ubiquinone/menaquinone biosynthesis C-methylase UbiE